MKRLVISALWGVALLGFGTAAQASSSYFNCADASGDYWFDDNGDGTGSIFDRSADRSIDANIFSSVTLRDEQERCLTPQGREVSVFFELKVLKVSARLFEESELVSQLYFLCESAGDSYPIDEDSITWEGDKPVCTHRLESKSGLID